ncbi:hypothetical protein NLJ89_g608 [Agrocybe chaxingu]|uniref:Uncharacterized protein n=1 Tax=Agrocybe chaxingu TaxID=84603 RepID=A0A9W8N1H9_9AGAR|nr:hypothetical protein NLJ89_g608 [Agrocybe chaxingu]
MLSLDSSWNRFTKDQADRLKSLSTQAEQAKKRQQDTKQRLQEAQHAVTTAQAQYGAVYNRTVEEEARYLRVEESCQSRQGWEAYESSIPRRAEITMSHTCQRIRSVLLDCPEVGTSITLVAGLNEVVPLDHLEEYLKRSGNRLLDIWLDFRHESYPPFKGVALEHPREILRALLPHAGRWRRFTVLTSHQTPLHSALSYIECLSAPYLEHFAVCLGDHRSILLSPPPPVDFLGSYTSLEDSATPHWQHIQVLTINQEIQGAPEQFTKFAKERHANSRMKLRIHSSIIAMWTAESQKQLRELRSVIDIEECDDYTLLPRYWPPGEGVATAFSWT